MTAGSLCGSALAAAGSRQLHALIRGSDETIATIIALTIAGTLVVAAAASWAATRRVASLDIMHALRPE